MVYSMTAYAESEIQDDWGRARFEIKSINHRYLELGFKLPEWCRDLEPILRDIARLKLSRGKVDCTLRFLEFSLEEDALTVNYALIKQLTTLCKEVQELLPEKSSISPFDILKWPNVVKNVELNSSLLKSKIIEGFEEALNQLLNKRKEEGTALKNLILERLNKMKGIVAGVRKRFPLIYSEHREQLLNKIKSLDVKIDSERVEQEIVFVAAKLDVEEELDRISIHIKATEQTLNTEEAMGRRLDFLMQELNREANTVSSKSMDSEIIQSSIELKVLIEQIREQVQNLV